MKDINNTEELFDELFKEGLENAASAVPPGVWEGVSSSISSGAAVAGAATKTALWMKAAAAIVAVSAASFAAYQYFNSNTNNTVQTPVLPENTSIETPVIESGKSQETKVLTKNNKANNSTSNHKHSTQDNSDINEDRNSSPEVLGTQSGPNPVYSIDANLVKPELPGEHNKTVTPVVKDADKKGDYQEEVVKAFEKPEYTFFKDSSFIFIPNTFSPNGDGINDSYLIKLVGEEKVEIIIYDLKNEVLFRTNNKYVGWDCKLKNGEEAPAGSYIVKVIYNFKGKESQTEVRKLVIIK